MRFPRKIIAKLLLLLSNCFPKVSVYREEDAMEILRNAGFKFYLLPSPDFTRLLPDEIDVSIVIPVYNAEKYLDKCLNSIVLQKTKYNYEIICVNDGSSDGSLDILHRYALENPKIVRVFNQENHGISVARNKGLELSRGRYVGFMDNDDYVNRDYIQKCMEKAYQTDSDIVQTGIIEELVSGKVISKTDKNDIVINNVDISDKQNLSGYVWNGVIRKQLFENVRFPIGFWYEDMIMVMILFRLCKRVAVIKDCLYHKSIHDSNASKTLWNCKNIKSVEKYWLAKLLSDYGRDFLKLKDNKYLYHSLLYEFATSLFFSIKGVGLKEKKAVFSLCSEYLQQHRIVISLNNKYLKKIEESYIEGNYFKYALTCLASRLS